MNSDVFLLSLIFVLIVLLEKIFPFFQDQKEFFAHDVRNVSIAVANSMIDGLFFIGLIYVVSISKNLNFGLIRIFEMPFLLQVALSFICLDLWMYCWHRANHEIDFLWLFHRVHHTDTKMDSTTAFRFHPIEIFMSNTLSLLVFFCLGISLEQFIFYKSIMFAVILFHHSNIKIPANADKIIKNLIVSPAMHRVHHSMVLGETNSNYGSVFSFWDKIFKSFRFRTDVDKIIFGIGKPFDRLGATLKGMLLVPFFKLKRRG